MPIYMFTMVLVQQERQTAPELMSKHMPHLMELMEQLQLTSGDGILLELESRLTVREIYHS